jgi:putative DNA primase/helicase
LSHNALDYDFNPDAPEPEQFLTFLDSILGDDPEAEDLLQEIVGYIVSGATSLQKIFAIVGPKRAGKGVLGRLIVALIGAVNACSPSFGSFATNFPLQPLLGKTLALMSDARLDSQVNQKAIVEHLLRVSGEDEVNVARKNRTDWSGRLSTRFMLLTNEVPRLADASGALAGRFVTLVLTKSFFGKEDTNLTDRLLLELPGILNWALDGWDRLQEQGRFTVPTSSNEVMLELQYLSSPVMKFIDDDCIVGEAEEVTVDALYSAWEGCCRRDGQRHVTTKATFARDLRAVLPSLTKVRKNKDGRRVHFYLGISLDPSTSKAIANLNFPNVVSKPRS